MRIRLPVLVSQSPVLATRAVNLLCICDLHSCEYPVSSATSSYPEDMRCCWVCVHEIGWSPAEFVAAIVVETRQMPSAPETWSREDLRWHIRGTLYNPYIDKGQ